jgi:hypothetical protein
MADRSPHQHQSHRSGILEGETRGAQGEAGQDVTGVMRSGLVLDSEADDQLMVLRTIGDRDPAADPLDSATLARGLGWTAARTAEVLRTAKGCLLIWGIRVGGTPAPVFEEIELTVQGRRLLIAADG